jgi:hypothetical protein
VLALFGDHLPTMCEVYGTLGLVDGVAPEKRPTPWVIVSSQDDQASPGAGRPLRVWQLPGEILGAAGIHGDTYLTARDGWGVCWARPRTASGADAAGGGAMVQQQRDWVALRGIPQVRAVVPLLGAAISLLLTGCPRAHESMLELTPTMVSECDVPLRTHVRWDASHASPVRPRLEINDLGAPRRLWIIGSESGEADTLGPTMAIP